MRLVSNIAIVIGVLLSVLESTTSFLIPTFVRRCDTRFYDRNEISMSDRSSMVSGRGGGRSSGGRGRGDGAGRGKPLDQREGSRALTRAELKAKEIYDATKEPTVVRLHAPEDRVALSELSVGQKLRGRIISVKEFGMFVDIGSKRDGLVHVKDISKDYFINNHQSKFIPGQDVDVWVKFVEEESYKLGLQMFPVSDRAATRANPTTVNLDDISEQDEVSGTVVRVSNYGVFIDIGAGVDAFLHRRKMKLNKKSMILKPWEVAPLGSTVKAFVHEVDSRRKRIGLTTYAPEQWNDMLPMKAEYDSPMVEDEEELGGSAMAENLRALERTLSLNLGDRDGILEGEDDEDDDDEDDDEDDEGEELTAEEIRALTSGRTQQPQILIDDFGGKAVREIAEGAAKGKGRGFANGLTAGAGAPPTDAQQQAERRRKEAMNDQAEEISVEELFRELCVRGRDYVTVKDIKKWDYLQELMKDGELTEEMVVSLFDEAGAVQGKLVEGQFEDFIDLLADELGLEEQGGDYDSGMTGDDDVVEEDEEMTVVEDLVLMDDFATADPSSFAPTAKKATKRSREQIEEDEMPDDMAAEDMNTDYDEELDFGLGSLKLGTGPFAPATAEGLVSQEAPVDGSISLSEHFERKSKTNDLFQYVFKSVAGKKGHVTLDDVMNWDFTQALLVQGQSSEEKVRAMFTKCKPVGGKLGITEFEKMVGMLSETEKQTKAQVDAQFGLDEREGVVDLTPESERRDFIAMKPVEKLEGEDDEDFDDEEDEEEEMSVEEVFAELSNGKKTVTFDAISEWDVVDELIEEGALSIKDLKDLFMQAGGKKKTTTAGSKLVLSLEGFEEFLDLLGPFGGEDGDDDDSDIEGMDELEVELDTAAREMAAEALAKTAKESKAVKAAPKEAPVSKDTKAKEIAKTEVVVEEDDEEDEELLSNVFKSLAGDKTYVAPKDLLNWDIVLELMGEGILTDSILKEKMAECVGYNGKGVTLEGFDQLVDKLVGLYGEEGGEEEAEGIESEEVEVEDGDDEDEEGEDDEEFIDIDTEEIFTALAKGKEFLTFADLKEWDLLKEMKEAGDMSDSQLRDILKAAGVKDSKKMDLLSFEAVLDELSANMEDEDDMDGMEEMEADDIDDINSN